MHRNIETSAEYTSSGMNIPVKGFETRTNYYIEISVGTPPQPVNVILDTGSGDTAFIAQKCQGPACGATHGRYDPSKSSTTNVVTCKDQHGLFCFSCTLHETNCNYTNRYGAGQGFYALVRRDTVSVGGHAVQNQAFGSIYGAFDPPHMQPGPVFPPPTLGIMGIGPQGLSTIDSPSPVLALMEQKVFSSYMAIALHQNKSGGYFTLGGTSPYGKGSIEWMEMLSNQQMPFYMLQVFHLYLGDYHTEPENPFIVDSGTPGLGFSSDIMSHLKSSLLDMCKTVDLVGICHLNGGKTILDGALFEMTPAQVAMYPTFSFSLGKVVLETPPYLYLEPMGKPGQYGSIITDLGTAPIAGILGDSIFSKYAVNFQLDYNQIGFAPTDL